MRLTVTLALGSLLLLPPGIADADASLHAPVVGETEAGVSVDGVVLRDPLREGRDEFGVFGGTGLFVDAWQVDARLGWSFPSPLLARQPQIGAVVALGRSL